MTPRDLKGHKLAQKQLQEIPTFRPLKRNKLSKPFKKLGGPRIQSTDFLDVSDTHVVFMYWVNGAIFTDRKFYAYLFCRLQSKDLSPLFEFHWHPSHKGFHGKTPCKTSFNYTNRLLPGAPELALSTNLALDPRIDTDRLQLIAEFCNVCGISLPNKGSDSQPRLCP